MKVQDDLFHVIERLEDRPSRKNIVLFMASLGWHVSHNDASSNRSSVWKFKRTDKDGKEYNLTFQENNLRWFCVQSICRVHEPDLTSKLEDVFKEWRRSIPMVPEPVNDG